MCKRFEWECREVSIAIYSYILMLLLLILFKIFHISFFIPFFFGKKKNLFSSISSCNIVYIFYTTVAEITHSHFS